MEKSEEKNTFASALKFLLLFQITCFTIVLFVEQMPERVQWFLFSLSFLLCLPNLIISYLSFRRSLHLPTRKGKTTSVLAFVIEVPILALVVYSLNSMKNEGMYNVTPSIIILFLAINAVVWVTIFILLKRKQRSIHKSEGRNSQNIAENQSNPNRNIFCKLSLKKICIFSGIMIVFAIIVVNIPSKNERRALTAVNELQAILKDPDSLKLRGDILVFDDDSGYCVVFKYSATNSYGGPVSNIAYCCEYGYIGDKDTNVEEITSSIAQERYVNGSIYWTLWQISGDSAMSGCKIVKGSKIAQRAQCGYTDY